ncbi:MAG: D-sedoheptulose 7-phosphate isomerase [Bacteroidales bacterium]|nr:D-sedoheptulose 7-phosphate isomerase [Bacteroidales bacterium]
MNEIKHSLAEASKMLDLFTSDEKNLEAIEDAGKLMVECIKGNHKIISCGNGGSMSDAMHFAEELTGLFREMRPAIAALSISDPSHITCAANDFGFENIFSRYIEGIGQPGDVLLAISTSGNSKSVLNAAVAGRNKQMKIVALTGKDGGKLAHHCDVEIRAPYSKYSDRTQEIHIKVIHCLIQYIESHMI